MDADRPSLFVRTAGRGAPLLLLHGLASSSRYWEPHLDALGRSYQVIAPDLLGFGRSPRPRSCAYTPADHIAALRRVAVARPTEPLTLVGHSLGAILALHFAVAEPSLVERLVLVSLPVLARRPFGHTVDGSHRRLHRLAVHTSAGRALCTAGIGALAPAAAVVYPRLRPDLPPGAARDAVRTDWTAYWRTLEATVFAADVPALFAAVRAPMTILHGRDDLIAPVGRVRELAQSRSDVRYIELAAGHNPCYTSARAFYDLLSVEGEEALSRTAHALLRLVSAGRGRLVARIAAAR